MKKRLALTFAIAAAFALPRASSAEPPVDVEIADEEAQDFFSSDAAEEEEEEEEEEGVRRRASDAFEELEATEKGAKIKRKKRSRASSSHDDSNINQNVVNVVVVSGDKETKAEAKSEAKAEQPATPAEQPAVQKASVQEDRTPPPQKPAQPTIEKSTEPFYGHNTWKSWWEREPGIGQGDILFFAQSGGYGGGLYFGLGLEGMFTDWGGIRLTINATGFDRYDYGNGHRNGGFHVNKGDWDFFLGGETIAPRPANAHSVDAAFLHLEDLSLAFHLGGDHGIDLYPSIGVSHFGYYLDTDGGELNGGSGFLRAGAGLQWVYKRFFAGVDVGWYPIELFRYGVEKRADGNDEFVQQDVDDPTDPRRITFTAHLGLSL